jgi:hypothetical protein
MVAVLRGAGTRRHQMTVHMLCALRNFWAMTRLVLIVLLLVVTVAESALAGPQVRTKS